MFVCFSFEIARTEWINLAIISFYNTVVLLSRLVIVIVVDLENLPHSISVYKYNIPIKA